MSGNPQILPETLAELHLLESAIGGQSIIDFVPRVSPRMPGGVDGVSPHHLKVIADAVAQAEYGPVRIAISVPPRHGKTELILHLIAWWLGRHPEHTIAYASYGSDLAEEKSMRARELAEASGVPLMKRGRGDRWLGQYGGGMLATGVGGPLTGKGCNLLIVDDPIKNREDAESPTIRQKTYEWFTSTASSRPTPGGSVLVVHTRWHPDDLIGRLKKKGGWQIINLPALDLDGEALWPEGGWTKEVLAARRIDVGEYDWSALYMGDPQPRGAQLFREPSYYGKPVINGASILIAVDPAATAKTHADYSVIGVGACYLNAAAEVCIDLLDVVRMQVEIPRLVDMIVATQARWGAPVAIESVGGFRGVPQMVRQIAKGVRIVEISPTADKFTRALPTAAAWNAGRIRLPTPIMQPDGSVLPGKVWVPALCEETGSFTGLGDLHDDQVDMLAHMYSTAHQFVNGRKSPAASEVARYMPFG